MLPRAVWLLCLTCLGCQAVLGPPTNSVEPHKGQPFFGQAEHDEAREQLQQAIAARQDDESERLQLLHCHKKLLELAMAADDEFEVQLQRGIGLYLLAQERALLGDPAGEVPVEGLLFNAAACLTKAHGLRRDEARPCWYLHEVWRQLGQPQQAQRWLRQAENAAPFATLTPQERRGVHLASLSLGK